MTAVLELHVRVGGDPRHCSEFKSLCAELAKLNHPACPEMDWSKVEQLCEALFQKNGADLQSTVALVLARGHRYGLEGLVQSMALLEALLSEWPRLWPSLDPQRLETLDWLFVRLLPLLRGASMAAPETVLRLRVALEQLHALLQDHSLMPLESLRALHQLVDTLQSRLERGRSTMLVSEDVPEPGLILPLIVLPPAARLLPRPPQRRKGRVAAWALCAALVFVLTGWAAWVHWQSDQRMANAVPEPLSLASMMLFEAGSAQLAPEATRMLVSALMEIKFQPGWLIVISGHSDTTGDAEQNLNLSRERALAVRDWIQQMGDIPDSCFAIQERGDHQPVASNATPQGRAANRRVDIRLVPQAEACG